MHQYLANTGTRRSGEKIECCCRLCLFHSGSLHVTSWHLHVLRSWERYNVTSLSATGSAVNGENLRSYRPQSFTVRQSISSRMVFNGSGSHYHVSPPAWVARDVCVTLSTNGLVCFGVIDTAGIRSNCHVAHEAAPSDQHRAKLGEDERHKNNMACCCRYGASLLLSRSAW